MGFFKKKNNIQNDDWMFWDFRDEDDFYGLSFLDATYMDPSTQKGFLKEYYLKIVIPDGMLLEGKFPSPETNIEIQALEDKLTARLESKKVLCKLTHRCIYFAAKRLLFEVADIVEFERVLNTWKEELGIFGLEITQEDPWVIYNEIQPDEYAVQQMGNRQVFQQLIDHGSNPEKIHLIEYAIFGKTSDLKNLQEELHNEGGKTITLVDDTLEIAFEKKLDLQELNEMTYYLIDKSKEHNCEYDGWIAAVVK